MICLLDFFPPTPVVRNAFRANVNSTPLRSTLLFGFSSLTNLSSLLLSFSYFIPGIERRCWSIDPNYSTRAVLDVFFSLSPAKVNHAHLTKT